MGWMALSKHARRLQNARGETRAQASDFARFLTQATFASVGSGYPNAKTIK